MGPLSELNELEHSVNSVTGHIRDIPWKASDKICTWAANDNGQAGQQIAYPSCAMTTVPAQASISSISSKPHSPLPSHSSRTHSDNRSMWQMQAGNACTSRPTSNLEEFSDSEYGSERKANFNQAMKKFQTLSLDDEKLSSVNIWTRKKQLVP